MKAAIFASSSAFGFFSSGEPAAGKRSLYLLEIADVTSPSNPQKAAIQVAVSGIQSAGNQFRATSQRSRSTKRTTKSNENQTKSPNQEEVIALFNRIQDSIAKQRLQRSKEEKTPKDESVSAVLRDRSKLEKDKANSSIDGDKVMRSGSATKDITQQGSVTEIEYRPTRLPSKFVRQSPIPCASAPRDGVKKEEHETQIEDEIKDMKLAVIGKMKLPELKEVAKSRGIKGYSKLKKNELLELLQS